jgi:hypothetical protein
MELATRRFAKSYVNGLSRCIENDARLSSGDRISWNTPRTKALGCSHLSAVGVMKSSMSVLSQRKSDFIVSKMSSFSLNCGRATMAR